MLKAVDYNPEMLLAFFSRILFPVGSLRAHGEHQRVIEERERYVASLKTKHSRGDGRLFYDELVNLYEKVLERGKIGFDERMKLEETYQLLDNGVSHPPIFGQSFGVLERLSKSGEVKEILKV
jgi:hypothetical protein